MLGIYTYIPQTNCLPKEYSVAAILLLLFMVLISLVSVLKLMDFYISTFRSMCAVPNMAVFWGSLTSCFPGILLTYFLNDFEIVPVTPILLLLLLLLWLLGSNVFDKICYGHLQGFSSLKTEVEVYTKHWYMRSRSVGVWFHVTEGRQLK